MLDYHTAALIQKGESGRSATECDTRNPLQNVGSYEGNQREIALDYGVGPTYIAFNKSHVVGGFGEPARRD